jgi:hypothetical protein
LSKYFSEPWLLANGFRDADPAAPAVAGLLPERRTAAMTGVVVLTPSATTADARRAFAGSQAGTPELALVALPRRGADAPRALGDVVGALRRSALDGQPEDQPIAALADPPPPGVGAGERPADALARLPADRPWAAVLVDGRVTALIKRTDLARHAESGD